ncbi:MAG: hypothetical protein ABR526_08835 [Chthoniobacterales bacterium]
MQRRLLFITGFLASVLSGSLHAKTIEFPKDHPQFSVAVPAGWQVHYDGEGPLIIQTPDASIVAVFDGALKGVTNAATAKKAVGVQMKATAETTGFTDFREIEGVQEMQLTPAIDAMGAKYHAKFPSGEPCIYIVAIFAPKDADYFSAELSVKARALTGKLDEQRQALLDSIKAVNGDNDGEDE